MTRTYTISGVETTALSNSDEMTGYVLSKSVAISNTRDGGQDISISAKDTDIVEMNFEDETMWIGNAGELSKLFDSDLIKRGSDASTIYLPTHLSSTDGNRGLLKKIAIKVIKFFKPGNAITDAIVKQSAKLLDEHLQPAPGLFYLDNNFNKVAITKTIPESEKPYLLLIHGTAASIYGSFHKMIEKREFGLWENIVRTYENRVLALDHYTLSLSPFENALEILRWLPQNTKLHIISTSRGGLVGELLARYNSLNTSIGFSAPVKEIMVKAYGDAIINSFETAIHDKRITIEKFTRIACPAAGTTLLSNRLDLFFNVLLNGINLIPAVATTGVIPIIKRLIADILSCKSDPKILPGLYAMNPDSEFIKALNYPFEVIETPLHVIAGNSKFELNPKGFITALSKLFYLHKNDWIVDTKSMTKGIFRSQNIGYFYDEGPDVNHFSYFYNQDTQQAVSRVIDAPMNSIAPGFESFDRLLPSNKDRGWIMGNLAPKEISGTKPVLILIPGILGSNLAKDGDEIYLNIRRIMAGRMTSLKADATGVNATSLIGSFYSDFSKHFGNDYDVAVFPYDWRLSLDGEAQKLNEYIKHLMDKAPGMPVKIVAHSMGGVLTRQFISKFKNDTWARITSNSQYKVLFLGSPLGGSFLIPEILVGKGKRIKQMAGLDIMNNTEELLKIFSDYEGLLNLLPITNTPYDFTKRETWSMMKQKSTTYNWSIPSDQALQNFKLFQQSSLGFDASVYLSNNIIYLAGKGDHTADGFYFDENAGPGNELTFTATPFGDGSVTWESGIPKQLSDNGRVYYCNTSHGDLANDADLFDGIAEILKLGRTNLISQTPPLHRGSVASYDMPNYILDDQTQESLERVLMGATEKTVAAGNQNIVPISIELKCGDLRYATYPIMVGHIKSDGIMSTEKVVDGYFNNILGKRLATGNYPGEIGESRYFVNPNKKPLGAVIVGMGKTEKLSGYQLEETIKQGFLDYLCSQKSESTNFRSSVGISTLLLGCGYAGLSIETSIKAIISAAHKANELIRNNGENIWPTINKIELIEIYEDKALQALICLDGLMERSNLNFTFQSKMQKLLGSRKRLNFENTSDWWQRISIEQEINNQGNNEVRNAAILFNASMGTAREEVRRLNCSKSVLESLVSEISSNNQWSPDLAKTIFELLIPNDFKLAIRNQQNLLLIVDKFTASYPWEMLQDVSIQASPISTTVGMIRQLSTDNFRKNVTYTQDNRALIIGDPQTDGFLHSLPGALKEAQAINKILEENGFDSVSSFQDSSSTIIKKLFKSDYKIIHLAGHGIFDKATPENSGMVIGNNVILSAREIEQLSYVPEMVFINCCHLGKTDIAAESNSILRYKLAANLGTQLIEMGVKVVVAAGWAIDDAAAYDFTRDFYANMFAGYNFGDSIKNARKKCFENHPDTNTWGAYQCYGDQFYTLTKTSKAKKKDVKRYFIVEQAKIDLENLINSIEANYSETRKAGYISELNLIIDGIESARINNSHLDELIATFYKEIGEEKISLELFKKLFEKGSNNFSIKAFEEYSRLRVRYYQYHPNGIDELKQTITELENLCNIRRSAILFNVLGSAYKSIAVQQSGKARTDLLKKSIENYLEAYFLNKNAGANDLIYSLSSALILEKVCGIRAHQFDIMKELESAYTRRVNLDESLTFWDMMMEFRYLLCKFILEYDLKPGAKKPSKAKLQKILTALEDVWSAGGTKNQKVNIKDHLVLMFSFFNTNHLNPIYEELTKIISLIDSFDKN